MGFQDDLAKIQERRRTAQEKSEQEKSYLEELGKGLADDATARLREAAAALLDSGIKAKHASLAHKQRPSWQWPTGRARVEGWILQCGDQPMMLGQDGWLAAVHECSDTKKTLCACAYKRSAGPLPHLGLGIAPETPDETVPAHEVVPGELLIRTRVQGQLTDFGFNAWLAEQVAVILEAETAT